MLWLKRNLFLALGGLVAVVLLGVGGVYVFGSYRQNDEVDEKIKQAKTDLQNVLKGPVSPSQANISIAREQKTALSQYSLKAAGYFTPLPYDKKVKGQEFKQ